MIRALALNLQKKGICLEKLNKEITIIKRTIQKSFFETKKNTIVFNNLDKFIKK